MTRLLFDPGDKWEYGSKLDWCGLIVEHCGGGFRARQILPFGDPVSFGGYFDFETAAYSNCEGRRAA